MLDNDQLAQNDAAPAPAEETPAAPRAKAAKKSTSRATKPAAAESPESPEAATDAAPKKRAPRKKAVAAPAAGEPTGEESGAGETAPAVTKPRATRARKVAAPAEGAEATSEATGEPGTQESTPKAATKKASAKKASAKKSATKAGSKSGTKAGSKAASKAGTSTQGAEDQPAEGSAAAPAATAVVFQAPVAESPGADQADRAEGADDERVDAAGEESGDAGDGTSASGRRRRRRGGRRRRKSGEGPSAEDDGSDSAEGPDRPAEEPEQAPEESPEGERTEGASSRRRRRRRRAGEDGATTADDPAKTVTRVRQARSAEDQITAVSGSTRLEAKKQRRREGREAGRRRAPIVSEAEFLARREAVERVMVIRERQDLTQIAVLEDKVLVEHYVARESQTSLIGNVYLGRVQNVLPSMEAAFIDIGKGRNAVLYAGEVNWSSLGHKEGEPRKIESVLKSGQSVLVQVTKDPVGHKGARLTSQISLAGRFLVYVPDGTTNGISRKLPDIERNRLKTLLKEIVPGGAGVIVRTAAEGASEEELTRDVERLTARWADIEKAAKGGAPKLLYGEPDLTLKVVRDLFTEDFRKLVIEGAGAWETVHDYVEQVAPDLLDRLERFEPAGGRSVDVFAAHRLDEQIHKALDRKVWLPSGGSLVIDRTEAMTVVDVNTGKFTGSGGNLEETVTKNNLEAAEEIVRQLRLRDIGGIIVIDFIDMVLESNRDLVLRRLVECLGRDRTRHQVAEVTSLGLVQMTRKRIGTGLLEAFSETCEACQGRGLIVHDAPVESKRGDDDSRRPRRSRGRGAGSEPTETKPTPSPRDLAASTRPEPPATAPEPDPVPEPDAAATAPEVEPEIEPDVPDVEAVPESAPEPESGASVDVEPAAEPTSEPTPEPVTESATDTVTEPAPEPAPEPGPPTVVTRTRRRSASRPAGPPARAEEATDVPADGEPIVAEESATVHVPIKKRGSRKR